MGTLQYVYWSEAVRVAKSATIWQEKPYWTRGGPGSFFPWPMQPGPLTVMTPMTSSIDQLVFYLIRTWLFVPIAISLTLLFGYLGWRIGEMRKTSPVRYGES